jgi:hypothetical protein
MSKPRDERQKDLFRPALDKIIDLGHPLVRLAGEIDWEFLASRFGAACTPRRSGSPIGNSKTQESRAEGPLPCKIDYFLKPDPPIPSTVCGFFTGDR